MTFRILDVEDTETPVEIKGHQYLDSIIRNRDRIQKLSSLIAQTSGILTSANMVTLFFIIREGRGSLINMVEIFQFASIFSIIAALFLSIHSVSIQKLLPSATMSQQINNEIRRFYRERKLVLTATYFLFFAIMCFSVSIAMFAVGRANV